MSKKSEKKVDPRVDHKFVTTYIGGGLFGGVSFEAFETYEEAEEQAQKTAYKSGEEILIYQAIASAEPKVKESVNITKLT